MPISLIISLSLTFIYALLSFNREIFETLYLKLTKIDVVGALAITSWVYYCLEQLNITFAVISTIMIFITILLGQLSLYRAKAKQTNKVDKETITNLANNEGNSEEVKAVLSTASSFIGKRGPIKGHINGHYYLGSINMGTEDSPSIQDILLYNEDGFKNGDTYEIVYFVGSKIVAKKV